MQRVEAAARLLDALQIDEVCVMPFDNDDHQPPSAVEMTIIIVLFSIFLIGVIAALIHTF